ncbi:MAG: glycoside hydrolase family 28 protein [Candidatus Sumerlaeota bacterium]|nr:glycoside hydrolase family 28 protein [Candidatus Sumerlaeota bacterium]
MKRLPCILLLICGALAVNAAEQITKTTETALMINVKERGAVGDGVTLCTEAIQKAIDQCSAQGGGKVLLPAGRYLAGTIQLKDNVTLHLDDQAVLAGSVNAADYRNLDPFMDGVGSPMGYALLVAVGARNIRIEGEGGIDGQGKLVAAEQKKTGGYKIRPFLVRLIRCENASMSGVHLRNSGAWTLHLFQCKQATLDHLTIDCNGLGNNDGIDIDSCQGVRVSACNIDTGDDAICLKATSALPCRDVAISDCALKSSCATIKLGTESVGDFVNIKVDNCRILGAGLGGIKLFSVDGSHMENVALSDIQMENVSLPVMVRLGARLKTFRQGEIPREVGVIRNVSIKNIQAKKAELLGLMISGIPGHAVENLKFENISIELSGGGSRDDAAIVMEEKEKAYPEISMFGNKMPAYGVFARHVRGLKINNLTLTLASPDLRPAFQIQDVANHEFTNWKTPSESAP